MKLETNNYINESESWPSEGKHIMAQYDEEGVFVYQAYRPAIGLYAVENQYFGGPFSYTRMSWIKPNFLWMMYRSGWGQKEGQEVVLAIKLKRDFFSKCLLNAFPSSNIEGVDEKTWRSNTDSSNVRLQWDPDHDPYGKKLNRRAIQLGLRKDYLEPFSGEVIIEIQNISEFVNQQYQLVKQNNLENLIVPKEKIYPVTDAMKHNLRMSENE